MQPHLNIDQMTIRGRRIVIVIRKMIMTRKKDHNREKKMIKIITRSVK